MKATRAHVFTDLTQWREERESGRFASGGIGFVPTMGALHEGHRSLLRRARAECDHVVMSVFVNPTQFDNKNDLAAYPRTLESDVEFAGDLVDAVIVPSAAVLYADDYRYRVTETDLSRVMEGEQRPGHFDGVLTVVMKLFSIVQPERAYFGRKDWQQLQLVRGMVSAFFLPVEIVECETEREPDGLAMSSRNRRLSSAARVHAAAFPKILSAARDPAEARSALSAAGLEVDYVEERDGVRLGAVRLEGVRLLDNVRL
ncbi:MAG TPA: pantoate--beta-alanine ligase [Opitutaceae bacterium]|nr:pantoate--beta-alanine ligase [Opitutaceae bacterium]